MAILCTRCSRANPDEAAFCFFDGTSMGNGVAPHAAPSRQPFPMPFVFPSGKRCATFDELVLACAADWKDAQEMLHEGTFAGFLAAMGRGDLSRAAKQAQKDPDADRALDSLLRLMPSTQLQPPKLTVQPGRISLGELKPGQDVRLELRLENAGMGLLSGSASSDKPWLLLGAPEAPSPRKVFQFLNETTIPFHICGKSLRASSKPIEGDLVLETTGGRMTVPLSFTVPVVPYPDGLLAGAATPRQVAEKAMAKPSEAGRYFASGAVARWYAANGWDYPVREPAPTGVAAVQQFFEALGLSKPPKVTISRTELDLSGRAGERVSGTIELLTDDRKPVWASVSCDAPWLDVRESDLAKKPATVRLGASRLPGSAGDRLTARVTITTNGRVRHTVTVRIAVQTGTPAPPLSPQAINPPSIPPLPRDSVPASPWFTAPPSIPPLPRESAVATLQPTAPPATLKATPAAMQASMQHRDPEEPETAVETGGATRTALAWLPVGVLALGMLVPVILDARAVSSPDFRAASLSAPFVEEDVSRFPEALVLGFDDTDRKIILAPGGTLKPVGGGELPGSFPGIQPATMRFGLFLKDGGRKLNWSARGRTNNCVVLIDGQSRVFGDSGWKAVARPEKLALPGRWIERDASANSRNMRQGRRSTWECGDEGIQVTQTVGLIPGEQSSSFDTCRVHYKIANTGRVSRKVGLRFLLDTYIGSNDGVPFLIPGQSRLCSDKAEFTSAAAIPDFIQACEREDLAVPGTVARIGLRLPGLEPPTRLTLGAYPNPALNQHFPWLGGRFRQMMTPWDVPVVPIKSLAESDSAVVIYWDAQPLAPGRDREMAFTYGLGTVSSGSKGQLALTAGGSFFVGGEFTLTAYVKDPARGERLTLELPTGFSLVQGSTDEFVPPLPADRSTRISPVTWRVRAGREGSHTIKVRTASGLEQTQPLRIKAKGIFGG